MPSLFSRVQLFATLGVDAQSEAGSACILHSLSSKLLSCCRAYSPVSCPETEHKGAFTCLHSAPHSAGKCQSGWAPVIGTGSLGPLSPPLASRPKASGLGSVPGRLLSSGKGLALVGSFLPARWGGAGALGGSAPCLDLPESGRLARSSAHRLWPQRPGG